MALVKLMAGTAIDIPTRDEIHSDAVGSWQDALSAHRRESLRGIKWMRLPVMQATASGGAVTLDEHTAKIGLGPEQGYAWSITRLVVDGLTAGATPDIVNLYRNGIASQPPLWQFNGNNFGYTFNRLELVLLPGDTLKLASTGSFAATGLIRLTGELIEVPAEMLAKLV